MRTILSLYVTSGKKRSLDGEWRCNNGCPDVGLRDWGTAACVLRGVKGVRLRVSSGVSGQLRLSTETPRGEVGQGAGEAVCGY